MDLDSGGFVSPCGAVVAHSQRSTLARRNRIDLCDRTGSQDRSPTQCVIRLSNRTTEAMRRYSTRLRRHVGTIASGVVLAVVAMALQWHGPRDSVIHEIFGVLNCPLDALLTWIADTWYGGNTDQLLPEGVILWVAYWLLLGIGLSMLVVRGFRAFSRSTTSGSTPDT